MRKPLNRLARTSWDELRTRLLQELVKRTDCALYRAGVLPEPRVLSTAGYSPTFFFAPDEMPGRVTLLKQHLPAAVEETVKEADEILQHRFRLLGYRDLDYGGEIDWHFDAVHGKRAPLKPWYQVRFLDFEEAGDHKVIWELNRHQHLVTLAKAWAFTDDDHYIQEALRQFYSWQSANPYPMGINWGSSLEVAFRSLSWLWVRNMLSRAPGVPDSFHHDLVHGLARNGMYIERFLSTYFSPNTHLIGEAVALFFIGTLCPQLPAARRWQEKGLSIVLAEAERQVRPDGVYFEQSLYYHVYALDFFLHTRALAGCNQLRVPESFDAILRRMLEVVRLLSASGQPQTFGDDDGGRVFNPRRNRAEHMSDPLALGAALFQDRSLRDAAAPTEEAFWLFGEDAIPLGESPDPATPVSVALPDGGLYVMTSPVAQMLIDAGPHGSGRGGHGHADALSLRLSMTGRAWLVDPGSYLYIAPESQRRARDQFRGTAAHNTLRVDALDQAVPAGPFSWTSLPDVNTHEWRTDPRFDYFEGSHRGYMRLSEPVIHVREIFHLSREYWLVRDVLDGKGVHDFEIFWHFSPELQIAAFDHGLQASQPDCEALALLSAAPSPWAVAMEQGYVSSAYGARESAPVGIFQKSRATAPAEHATLLLPLDSGGLPGTFRCSGASDSATVYTFEREDIADTIVFGTASSPVWEFGPFRSHAQFFFARMRAGELETVIMRRVAFAEWNGRQFYRADDGVRILWVQWTRMEGLSASNPELHKFFDETVFAKKTAVPLRQ